MAIAGKGDDSNRNAPGAPRRDLRGSSGENSPGYPARVKGSPLGELELDAPIAGPRFFVGPLVERLEFAETSGGQAVGLDSLADQILHHRDRSCG
jgi:hypothetical protein